MLPPPAKRGRRDGLVNEHRNTRKRALDESEDYQSAIRESSEEQTIQEMAQYGRGDTRAISGMGSAWEGQMASLQSDAFQHHQMLNMKDDIHTKIFTSSHIMGQGGNICDAWTKVPAVCDVLSISMGHLTGNTHAGQANLFNQYYLCKLKKFRIQFKDIVVALETSTSIGMNVMSDVITEWRKRPQALLLKTTPASTSIIQQPATTEYQDWWGDWRPATDGCVTFDFDVNSGEIPAWIASTLLNNPANGNPQLYRDPAQYMTLAQFLYGFPTADPGCAPAGGGIIMSANGFDHGAAANSLLTYHPYVSAKTMNWMDYFFEWRARNCPNATSGANTSARYNVQIDAEWDMSYRLSYVPALYRPSTREKYDDEADVD